MLREDAEVVVVGGSWAGLAAALQLARARRRVTVVDAGRPRNRFARASHGFLGQDGRAPAAILETFRVQLLGYPTVRLREDSVRDAALRGDGTFELELDSGDAVRAARLVLATGVVDDLPAVPGLRERWGATVLHCPYCHGYEVADRRLGVLVSSEVAVHKALLLPDWSPDVTLFTAGTFVPDSEQRAQLAARGVRVETRKVEALVGDVPSLAGVQLEDGEVVPLDALFAVSTTRLAGSLAERLGCAVDEGPLGPIIRTDAQKETTVPGVFAAGDAARVPHSATLAAADGAIAGISVHQSLVFGSAAGPGTRR